MHPLPSAASPTSSTLVELLANWYMLRCSTPQSTTAYASTFHYSPLPVLTPSFVGRHDADAVSPCRTKLPWIHERELHYGHVERTV